MIIAVGECFDGLVLSRHLKARERELLLEYAHIEDLSNGTVNGVKPRGKIREIAARQYDCDCVLSQTEREAHSPPPNNSTPHSPKAPKSAAAKMTRAS